MFKVKSEFRNVDFSPIATRRNCPFIVTIDSQSLVERTESFFMIHIHSGYPSEKVLNDIRV